jgi:hypothetical protein
MGILLYVYDKNKLLEMQATLQDKRFISISYLMNICNSIDDLESLKFADKSSLVIDISNLIKDNNFFRVFTERYLLTISREFTDTSFCLRSEYYDLFVEIYPYLFDDGEISFDFRENGGTASKVNDNCLTIISPFKLFVYRNQSTIKSLSNAGKAFSLLNLIDEFDGLILKYTPKSIKSAIEKDNIEIVDISSVMTTFKLRKDFIAYVEVLIYHIASFGKVRFSICEEFSEEALQLFPMVFCELEYMDSEKDQAPAIADDINAKLIDIESISLIAIKIDESLQGHKVFKDDFRHNLLKYTFLNKLSERKMLSIFLCGDSGIGKTEFAKIASNIIYPNEQLIKINFGNYSTEGVLNSLIGSPLGYIGSEEGGELINKIKTSKSKIILIDEFERATPSVFNFFYELLEDGKFTDRHGIEHYLNGYIIIFTSNMSQNKYQDLIPNSLKSRFDMVYNFTDLAEEDKLTYIMSTAHSLIKKLQDEFNTLVKIDSIQESLNKLVRFKNLRDIKRKIEDIVFAEFFSLYCNK